MNVSGKGCIFLGLVEFLPWLCLVNKFSKAGGVPVFCLWKDVSRIRLEVLLFQWVCLVWCFSRTGGNSVLPRQCLEKIVISNYVSPFTSLLCQNKTIIKPVSDVSN